MASLLDNGSLAQRSFNRLACLLGSMGGARVSMAQAIVTVPAIEQSHQVELLSQTLGAIRVKRTRSCLDWRPRTMESRQPSATPSALDLQLSLSVTEQAPKDTKPWSKDRSSREMYCYSAAALAAA